VREAETAIEMIEADALVIHLNPLQEAIQPEGETKYSGVFRKIRELAEAVDIPIIVKETGAGISAEVAQELEQAGAAGIDVSGAGGTSWAAVEYYRATKAGEISQQRLGEDFWDWGLTTVTSLVEVCESTKLPVIASGGIRTGVEVAKSVALGAGLASMATPLLLPATKSSSEVKKTLDFIVESLRNTMFLVGAENVEALAKVPVVLLGRTAEWLERRGFKPETYARR
jgi:isopentenyl-diphosphate delta-isomerase